MAGLPMATTISRGSLRIPIRLHPTINKEDAAIAIESLDVDWDAQAVGSAENYLQLIPFSPPGLIDQLEFEGFTPEQAAYAADQLGL